MRNYTFAGGLSVILLGLLVTGCGERMTSVSGKVTFSDGSPVTRGCVSFDSGTYSASGDIKPDGSYVLGALKAGGGVRPGDYAIAVQKNWDDPTDEAGNSIDTFEVDPKFTSGETSGMRCVVEAGKNKVFDIVVEKKK